ncbi:MAG TPA: polynucleotide adenylyltransferase PcnB, partial [Vicinamibacteria bacterium]|nr:polynucleotide adenylyltransferase PcnB [Vicinamibacteria bacterium]
MSPRILPRPQHTVSRKGIDADALKVLYRLKNHGFVAYLVGGGVRDLLLARQPKDFDIGTSAHPQAVKRLFRNCFVIGRRFRLCHVRFGRKVVEVSTFRKQAPPDQGDTLIRRDNTFGTPEEDAFRRDFTVNALFYDIATFSVIDYVGGLEDLEQRTIRTIGDPAVRFREDPVRMLRAVALAARLGFTIERDTLEAIRALRGEIVKSSPARLLEEIYKILRQGASRKTFEMLHEAGLLTYLLPEADEAIAEQPERLLGSLSRLDDYRNAGLAAPGDLGNAVLMGTLLVPLGISLRRVSLPAARAGRGEAAEEVARDTPEPPIDVAEELAAVGGGPDEDAVSGATALSLPFARRDLDRLRLILAAQSRLREVHRSPRVKQMLAGRGYLEDALRWMEIHGGVQGQELAAYWRGLGGLDAADTAAEEAEGAAGDGLATAVEAPRRRRRRRRHRRRPRPIPP